MPKDVVRDTILAVDDDPSILRLVEVTIKLAGFNPFPTQNPHEALQIYEANAPTIPVVVTDRDYKLPDINGDKFAQLVRQRANANQPPLNVTIIMVTADPLNTQDKQQIKALGVDVIVAKPFSPAALRTEIIACREKFKTS